MRPTCVHRLSQALLWEQAGLLSKSPTTQLKRAEHFPCASWRSKCFTRINPFRFLHHLVCVQLVSSLLQFFSNYLIDEKTEAFRSQVTAKVEYTELEPRQAAPEFKLYPVLTIITQCMRPGTFIIPYDR